MFVKFSRYIICIITIGYIFKERFAIVYLSSEASSKRKRRQYFITAILDFHPQI